MPSLSPSFCKPAPALPMKTFLGIPVAWDSPITQNPPPIQVCRSFLSKARLLCVCSFLKQTNPSSPCTLTPTVSISSVCAQVYTQNRRWYETRQKDNEKHTEWENDSRKQSNPMTPEQQTQPQQFILDPNLEGVSYLDSPSELTLKQIWLTVEQ